MKLTHLDKNGKTKMVDVGGKEVTSREAVASAVVKVSPEVINLIAKNKIAKGNVLEIAKIAGIMAAKKTKELIPLCHQINLTHINLNLEIDKKNNKIKIRSIVKTKDRTGVEMEALTAAATAGLTIYDMCKAVDRTMEIGEIRLLLKKGGKSGTYVRRKS
ncbi:MAG: cyclic pyranopterin monophosphate synthase MoaC [bacterium]